MIDLHENEVDKIYTIVTKVQQKHMNGGEVSGEKLTKLHDELEGRLQDAGFLVTVDVTPLLAGDAPTVRIDGRIDSTFDSDKKAWEILKRLGRKGDDPSDKIEGVI